jgi:hypothetical protein
VIDEHGAPLHLPLSADPPDLAVTAATEEELRLALCVLTMSCSISSMNPAWPAIGLVGRFDARFFAGARVGTLI